MTYERPVKYESIVLYDADCPYCSAATNALRHIDDLGAVSWNEAIAQSFLEAQFGEVPFAIVLIDTTENRVYVGKSAAGELATQAGLPDLVSDLVEREFDRIESVADTLDGHERSPDDFHGNYELTDDAREVFDELAYMAWTLPSR